MNDFTTFVLASIAKYLIMVFILSILDWLFWEEVKWERNFALAIIGFIFAELVYFLLGEI